MRVKKPLKEKAIRIKLVPTTLSHVVCIGCGQFNCDYEIHVNGGELEASAGAHKQCLDLVKVKRGQ